MTELKVSLPDGLAREPREAAREFLAVAERVAARGVPPLSRKHIQTEIDAVRRARRRRASSSR